MKIERYEAGVAVCCHNLSHKKMEADLAIEGIMDEFEQSSSSETNIKSIFCTDYFLHLRNGKIIPMLNDITEYVTRYAKIAYDIDKEFIELDPYNVWGALYAEGDYTEPHHHFPAAISTVMYLSIPNRDTAAPLILEGREIKPYTGLLVIFPGVMLHHVPKTQSSRIILSCNYTIKPNLIFPENNDQSN